MAERYVGRIIGLETEYGCLVAAADNPRQVAGRVRDWVFRDGRYGLIDLHDRDWDEPAGNGGFLFNGGRIYLDMGHVEYCTPECTNAFDAVRYDLAGDRILQEAVVGLGLEGEISFIRNNVDHYTGATFGCHENYSLLREAPLTEANVLSLLAFLSLRILFCGSGRVGSARVMRYPEVSDSIGRSAPFQISQRADYIENDFFEWVQHNRAIINTRDEPLADPWRFRRLHLIHGDTNVLPAANFMKVGFTSLVLDLLEEDDLPGIELWNAVGSLREVSRQPRGPWLVDLADGREADAVEVLSRFRERAENRFRGRDPVGDSLLDLWTRVETGLAGDVESLFGLVDWVTKLQLFESFCQAEGLEMTDPWLEAQDLEYHHIDAARSLALAVADRSGLWADIEDESALETAPTDTRANVRSRMMRRIQKAGADYVLEWEEVKEAGTPIVSLMDPFVS